jgi:molybdate transport system regulatory protein
MGATPQQRYILIDIAPSNQAPEVTMKISARNRFAGTVTEVKTGAVMAQVTIDIGGGNHVTSAIFVDSVKDLGLKKGDKVSAIIKSTDVMVLKD